MIRAQPTGRRILVRPAEEDLSGPIARPETAAAEDPDHGEVIAVGPEAPRWIKVGDEVVWYPMMGFHYEIDGQPRVILAPSDIVAIMEEE